MLFRSLRDPGVVKTAFNAAFERVCISHYFGWPLMDPAQWRCTMVRAARMGLPLSLGQCGEVLRLADGKMKEGAALIRYFSVPNRGKRHLPADDLFSQKVTFSESIYRCSEQVDTVRAVRVFLGNLNSSALVALYISICAVLQEYRIFTHYKLEIGRASCRERV